MSLAKRETSKSFLWSFVTSAITGRLSDSTGSAAVKIFQTVPRHLRDDYVGAIVAFAIGITYNNILLGPLVRRLMFSASPSEAAAT
jgi:hypothetical protein